MQKANFKQLFHIEYHLWQILSVQKLIHTTYRQINMAWVHTTVKTMRRGTREDSTGTSVVSIMCYFARKILRQTWWNNIYSLEVEVHEHLLYYPLTFKKTFVKKKGKERRGGMKEAELVTTTSGNYKPTDPSRRTLKLCSGDVTGERIPQLLTYAMSQGLGSVLLSLSWAVPASLAFSQKNNK